MVVLASPAISLRRNMYDSDRLIDLEVRLAYLEDTLNALDHVVTRQAEQIALLEQMNRELYSRLQDIQAGQKADTITDEPPPPHY